MKKSYTKLHWNVMYHSTAVRLCHLVGFGAGCLYNPCKIDTAARTSILMVAEYSPRALQVILMRSTTFWLMLLMPWSGSLQQLHKSDAHSSRQLSIFSSLAVATGGGMVS